MHLDPCDFVPRGGCPLIVVQGTRDVQVSWKDACLLRDAALAAGRPVEIFKEGGLDHLLKRSKAIGLDALKVYRDRRRRIPIALIRKLARAMRSVATG